MYIYLYKVAHGQWDEDLEHLGVEWLHCCVGFRLFPHTVLWLHGVMGRQTAQCPTTSTRAVSQGQGHLQ